MPGFVWTFNETFCRCCFVVPGELDVKKMPSSLTTVLSGFLAKHLDKCSTKATMKCTVCTPFNLGAYDHQRKCLLFCFPYQPRSCLRLPCVVELNQLVISYVSIESFHMLRCVRTERRQNGRYSDLRFVCFTGTVCIFG